MPKKKQQQSTKKKQTTLDFEDWFAIAQKYYNEHGDLIVPRNYVDEEGHKLGRWIERMRAFYNGKIPSASLTTTGILMLNKIGMVWKLENRFPWEEWLLQCRQYYAANGDLLVPGQYKNGPYALGNWISEQRKKYKRGTLKKERIEALEKCGMVWEVVDPDVWEKRYNDAYAYFKQHGNLDVPPSVLTAGDMSLRDWLVAQKSLYQESRCESDLDWDRHDLLDDIGMNWDRENGKVNFSYSFRAKKYYEEHGNLDVPEDYLDIMGIDLREWVKRQWRLYHRPVTGKDEAYQARKQALEKIGFDWSCEGRWDWDPKEAAWLQNFNGVKAYVKEHGKLPIGEESIPLTTAENSEFWIAGQRVAIRNGLMNEDKKELLASIGVVYGQMETDWNGCYTFVKNHFEKYHQLPVGANSQKMPNGSQSGHWIAAQKTTIKKGTLPEEKVKMLKEIGIEYGQLENNWQANYNAVKTFAEKHGYLPTHNNSIILPKGTQSRLWITRQKKALKAGNISAEKEKLLKKIGICLGENSITTKRKKPEQKKLHTDIKKTPDIWYEHYEFAKQYFAQNGLLPRIGEPVLMPNGTHIQAWVKRQRKAIRDNTLPSEKIELLKNIGIVGDINEYNWKQNYECIKAYRQEYQKLPTGKNSIALPSGSPSSRWIYRQSHRIIEGTLTTDQINKLAGIGIIYGSANINWKNNYNAVQAYFNKYGKLPVNKNVIALPTWEKSSAWIRYQRFQFHRGRLDKNKVKLLHEIGIV